VGGGGGNAVISVGSSAGRATSTPSVTTAQ